MGHFGVLAGMLVRVRCFAWHPTSDVFGEMLVVLLN